MPEVGVWRRYHMFFHKRMNRIICCWILGLAVSSSVLVACSSDDSGQIARPAASSASGTTVQLSVTATDEDGDPLHYRWAATEGSISNVDAPTTTWNVPSGSGLQF